MNAFAQNRTLRAESNSPANSADRTHEFLFHGMDATCSCGGWSITADEAESNGYAEFNAHIEAARQSSPTPKGVLMRNRKQQVGVGEGGDAPGPYGDGPTNDTCPLSTSAATQDALVRLAEKWEADDNESLDTFGQHLMGGAVLSCAEQLRTVLDALGPNRVLCEVAAERQRQIAKGYTPEHDDQHHGDLGTNGDLVRFMRQRLTLLSGQSNDLKRHGLIEVAALAVAAIESLDRRATSEVKIDCPTCGAPAEYDRVWREHYCINGHAFDADAVTEPVKPHLVADGVLARYIASSNGRVDGVPSVADWSAARDFITNLRRSFSPGPTQEDGQ